MKKYLSKLKQYLKSRTINWALIMGFLGVFESYTNEISNFIGGNFGLYYSVSFGLLMVYMRSITTSSLEDKYDAK